MSKVSDKKKDDDYDEKEQEKNKLIKTKEKDPTEQKNIFGREQVVTTCPFCQNKILTNIEQQSTWIGICLSIVLFIVFRVYSLLLIILLIPLTQSTIHSCPMCLNQIGVRSFYDTVSLTDRVLSFQFMTLGIIITKKQLLGIFFFIFFAIFFYMFFSSIDYSKKILTDTWGEYTTICKSSQSLCQTTYLFKEISWKGFSIRVDYDGRFFSRYRARILVKMEENNLNEEPDLYLQFTDGMYEKYKTEILNTTRGDLIHFNGTIIFEGNSNKHPILEITYYNKLDKKVYISPHVHDSGRYSTSNEVLTKDGNVYNELPGLVSDEDKNIDIKGTNT